MNNSYYITTPIFYVNDVPHIGHAYTNIASDVIARYMRLSGKQVKFLTGTDEHGQKVEKSAEKAGISVIDFVDENSLSFQKMSKSLNISNDDFIRTTEERHKNAVRKLWNKLEENGNIYLGNYAGWYSIRDEAYYTEDELTEDGLAPTGASVEWLEEPSYFFALSKWQDKLLEYYENNPDFIYPKSRRNEVVSFVKNGLKDLSVSRTGFKWGIEVPGDNDHVIYVWLDALTNYISAIGYPEQEGEFKKYWPAAAHIVGKDILRFHAVYWPAFLMASGVELPSTIVAHGWWTNEGEKISKSLGNVIDPFELVDEFGLDPVRYFLMREISFGNDGNFSKDNLVTRNNSELANKIGNLLQRTASFAYKHCDQKIPNIEVSYINDAHETVLFKEIESLIKENFTHIESFNINKVLDNIIYIADQANMYIDKQAPWALRKEDPVKMQQVLYYLLEITRYIGIMLQPFVPDAAENMLDLLGVPSQHRSFANLNKDFALKPGQRLQEPTPIFPRL